MKKIKEMSSSKFEKLTVKQMNPITGGGLFSRYDQKTNSSGEKTKSNGGYDTDQGGSDSDPASVVAEDQFLDGIF